MIAQEEILALIVELGKRAPCRVWFESIAQRVA